MNPMKQQASDTSTVYDAHGNPISVDAKQFAASVRSTQPVVDQTANASQVVYMTRPHEPMKQPISDDVMKKHEQSKRQYPSLNLSEGEYVISAVRRHPIGILQIWVAVLVAMSLLAVGVFLAVGDNTARSSLMPIESSPWLTMIFLGLIVLVFLGGVIATMVYESNRFFLTNESVTQHIQISPFSRKEQTISLINIEDASFRQSGIIQTLLNYGTLRLSTQGDETTYRFSFVSDPGHQVAVLNDAVESFKNGRPIGDNN